MFYQGKKNRYNNRIGFFKTRNATTAQSSMENLKNKKLLGAKLDLKLVKEDNQDNSTGGSNSKSDGVKNNGGSK